MIYLNEVMVECVTIRLHVSSSLLPAKNESPHLVTLLRTRKLGSLDELPDGLYGFS